MVENINRDRILNKEELLIGSTEHSPRITNEVIGIPSTSTGTERLEHSLRSSTMKGIIVLKHRCTLHFEDYISGVDYNLFK